MRKIIDMIYQSQQIEEDPFRTVLIYNETPMHQTVEKKLQLFDPTAYV